MENISPLNSVPARQGILKNPKLGCVKREDNECRRNHAKNKYRKPLSADTRLAAFQAPCLIKVRDSRRYKEDSNVYPVGRLAYNAVICVKQNRNKPESYKRAAKLNTKKILPVAEEKALNYGKKQHRPK